MTMKIVNILGELVIKRMEQAMLMGRPDHDTDVDDDDQDVGGDGVGDDDDDDVDDDDDDDDDEWPDVEGFRAPTLWGRSG